MTATHTTNSTVSNAPVLYLALDLGTRDWMLAFTVGLGQPPKLKTIKARNTTVLMDHLGKDSRPLRIMRLRSYLLPAGEGAPQGRMRGGPWLADCPHPAVPATFSLRRRSSESTHSAAQWKTALTTNNWQLATAH
jgi:hypothetical protein